MNKYTDKDLRLYKLNNLPLKSNGVIRSNRCNILTFYCPICECFHTQHRSDTYVVSLGEVEFFICKKGIEID